MADEPNLSFDIDALFDHLTTELGHEPGDAKEWVFTLRSGDVSVLEKIADDLEEEFIVELEEHPDEVDAEGNECLGPPMLSIVEQGALAADAVKSIADRMQAIANEHGLVYEGVTCYEPIDDEELFGWLTPEVAGARLREMSDCGLEPDAELPWAFLVAAPGPEPIQRVADDLSAHGFRDYEEYTEPDEEGNCGMCVFVAGRNNEAQLAETSAMISAAAERHSGTLEGIQFYTREDVDEIFGDGSEA